MTYHLTETDIRRADSISRWFCHTKGIITQDIADYLSVGRLGLVKASQDYRPEQNANFRTYARIRVLGELKDYTRSNFIRRSKHPKAHTHPVYFEDLARRGWEPSADGLEGRTINKDLCTKLLKSLNTRTRKIFKLYYFEDLNMYKIAPLIGRTESRVFQIISGTLPVLRKRAERWSNVKK